ncbi:hypothetical protein TrRE_jg382, partial [Triparma retinervis]
MHNNQYSVLGDLSPDTTNKENTQPTTTQAANVDDTAAAEVTTAAAGATKRGGRFSPKFLLGGSGRKKKKDGAKKRRGKRSKTKTADAEEVDDCGFVCSDRGVVQDLSASLSSSAIDDVMPADARNDDSPSPPLPGYPDDLALTSTSSAFSVDVFSSRKSPGTMRRTLTSSLALPPTPLEDNASPKTWL